MADETPPRRPAPPEPASDAKKHANKLVVLSSVAKPPLGEDESLLGESTEAKGPPPLPEKTGDDGLIRPVGWTTRPGGTTTIIKLPPKTGVLPRLTSLSKGPQEPPSLSKDEPVDGDAETKRLPPIKLNTPAAAAPSEQESIFASPGSKPIEVKPPVAKRAVPPPLPPRVDKPSAVGPLDKAAIVSKPATLAPVVSKPASEPHHVAHVPPLVAHDAPAPESEIGSPAMGEKPAVAKARPDETAAKADPFAQTARLTPPPALNRTPGTSPAQSLLPLAGSEKKTAVPAPLKAEVKSADGESRKHRLPPRSGTTGKISKPVEAGTTATPPKVFPIAPPSSQIKEPPAAKATAGAASAIRPASVTAQPVKSTVTPPTIPLHPGKGMVKPPTIPLKGAPAYVPVGVLGRSAQASSVVDEEEDEPVVPVPSSRAVRMRKRRLIGIIIFYVVLVLMVPGLYFLALIFSRETRVEGQIIPPQGMLLDKQAWIVTDFRTEAQGITSDLQDSRALILQDMQEKVGHVQRAQADVATREARIRTFKDQIQADNDEEMSLVKQARDAAQHVWDGDGAELEENYQSRLTTLNQAILDRAKANRLQYNPDPNFYSPEVWANAYRLALYQVPQGVDSVKERAWLDAQMKSWHAFTKDMDARQNQLRDRAAQLKLAPAARVADLKAQVDDLQQRIDGTIAEEEPLKAELEQAKTDLAAVQSKEAALDARPYAQLDALPEQNVIDRLQLRPNGRFSWRELEKQHKYGVGEKSHVFWIFARAFRADGRQYWALHRFNIDQNSTALLMIEPSGFVSTRAILRPDLSPDEQAQ